MATYVNDLRLKEIGTGESSGTWGSETNVNLELIGEALSFGTEAITTNADTHTSTVADGSTDPARSMYIKYTGTLDSACTITIAPNTLSRLHFIENGTSGSQNIIISQGSGANVTIPPGDVKVVYLDGAGSGAAVVDAFASLSVVDLKVQDDLTVTDDATIGGTLGVTGVLTANAGVVIDEMTIDGDTITATDDFIIDAASDITLDADGADINLKDGGTRFGILYQSSNDFHIEASIADQDIKFLGTDGSSQITALSLDMSEAGAATFNAAVTVPGFISHSGDTNTFFGFPGDDQFRIETGGNERISVTTTETVINDDGANLDFRIQSDSTAAMFFVDGGTNQVAIGTSSPAAGYGLTVSHAVPAFFTAISSADSATYGGTAVHRDHTGNGQGTGIGFNMDDDAGGIQEYAYIGMLIEDNSNGAEDGSLTFRLTENAAARGRVAMTMTSNGYIQVGNNLPIWSGSYGGAIFFKGNNSTSDRHAMVTQVDSTGSAIHTGLQVTDGEVVVNNGSADIDFRVESDANTAALFVEGSTSRVGIGTSGPNAALDVIGTIRLSVTNPTPLISGINNNAHALK